MLEYIAKGGRIMFIYDDKAKEATLKYIKEKQHRIFLNYKKDVWNDNIRPVIEKLGMPVGTFIKIAVYEKILSDNLCSEEAKIRIKNVLEQLEERANARSK